MSNNSLQQAQAQIDWISDAMRRYREAQAADGYADMESIEQEIYEDPLEISVRSMWTPLGQEMQADEFRILLCTGGPAVQIVGDLDEHGCVYGNPRIEHQDWFEGWKTYPLTDEQQEALLAYCNVFNFY